MREPYKKYVKVVLNLLTALAILWFVIYPLPKIVGFFMPFVVGWIIALIANPLVRFLDEKIKIRRKAGSAIVIIAVIALIIGAIYGGGSVLIRELIGFIQEIPQLWHGVESDLNNAGKALEGFSRYFSPELQRQIVNLADTLMGFISSAVDSLGSPTVTAVGNFAKNIPSILVAVIMCLLSSYFFIAQREEVLRVFHTYMPAGLLEKWNVLSHSLKRAVGGYFKAQFKIELWMYVLLLIGFVILDVSYAALIALVIAVLDFFPVLGTGTVLIPWALVKILGGDYKLALGLLIIWGAGQLARQLIQPKIVGDSVGLPALPTIILLYVGYKIGSVGGMILAVPAGIILVNMYQAGFFSTTEDSIKILVHGFNSFRRLTDEDKKGIASSAHFDPEKHRKKRDEEKKSADVR